MLLNAYERNSNTADQESSKMLSQENKKSKKNAAQAEAASTPAVNGNHSASVETAPDSNDHPHKKVTSFPSFPFLIESVYNGSIQHTCILTFSRS